jgi:hypothetical protein
MSAKPTMRRTTCVCAAATMVLSAGSILLVFSAFGLRGDDLVVASSKTAVDLLGTCVAVPNKESLENAGYNKADYSCSSDEQKQGDFQRLVAASAHTLIWAAAQSPGEADLDEMSTVAQTAIMGGADTRAVNASTFYNAVALANAMTIPSTCALLYPGAVWDAAMTSTTPVLPNVACSGGVSGSGATSATANLLYSHCVLQHSYARSGPADGTFSMPLVGSTPGPMWWFWPNASGFNETSSWQTKSKMFLGARFSWSTTSYVPLLLACGFFGEWCSE